MRNLARVIGLRFNSNIEPAILGRSASLFECPKKNDLDRTLSLLMHDSRLKLQAKVSIKVPEKTPSECVTSIASPPTRQRSSRCSA
jgi:hypothetical protein